MFVHVITVYFKRWAIISRRTWKDIWKDMEGKKRKGYDVIIVSKCNFLKWIEF